MFPAYLPVEFPSLTLNNFNIKWNKNLFQCLIKSKAPVVKKSVLYSSEFVKSVFELVAK